MAFHPSVPCDVFAADGYNVHGESTYGPARRDACDVINITLKNQQSPIGSSYSESSGRSEEIAADLVVLMRPTPGVRLNDVIEIGGGRFLVSAVRSHYDWRGQLEHLEVEGKIG